MESGKICSQAWLDPASVNTGNNEDATTLAVLNTVNTHSVVQAAERKVLCAAP